MARNKKRGHGGSRHHGGSRARRPTCTHCHKPLTRIDRHDPTPLCRCYDEMDEPSALQNFIQLFGIDAAR